MTRALAAALLIVAGLGLVVPGVPAHAAPSGEARPAPLPPAPLPPPTAPPPPVPRPFGRGSMNLGLALGVSAGAGTVFSLGAGFGYFVLPGLEPGLELEVTFGSEQPTVTSLLPYLRWVVWRSYTVSPYLKVQGGRWFVSGQDDLSAVGGGGGLVFFVTRTAGVQLQGLVFRLFPDAVCGDSCVVSSVGLSLGLYFGGAPPARPAPAPPPEPAEPRDEPVPWKE